jgi:hypothetical protein
MFAKYGIKFRVIKNGMLTEEEEEEERRRKQ